MKQKESSFDGAKKRFARAKELKSKNAILPKLATGEKIYIAGKYYTLNICDCKRLSLSGSTINLPSDNYKKALISFTKKKSIQYSIGNGMDNPITAGDYTLNTISINRAIEALK